MQPLRNCNGPTIRIGREILCLPYAGFFAIDLKYQLKQKCMRTLNNCIYYGAGGGDNFKQKQLLFQVICFTL